MSSPSQPVRPVAIVTGGAAGIGLAIAQALAGEGYRVAIVDRDAERLAQICGGEGGEAFTPFVCDITQVERLPALVDEIAAGLGAPWLLVNNAARGGGGAIAAVTPERFDAVFAVSVRASFFLTQAVVAHMATAGGGRIINISSLIAARGDRANSHYAGAKAAMIGLVRAWSIEFAPLGITANAILPALTDTPMTRAAMDAAAINAHAGRIPMGRLATGADCAALALYLASPAAGFVTGQVISPNGGEFAGAL